MSHSVSRQGNEGQEKEKPASPDPRKASCAHKGPGSHVGTCGMGGCGGGGGEDTTGLYAVRACIQRRYKENNKGGKRIKNRCMVGKKKYERR